MRKSIKLLALTSALFCVASSLTLAGAPGYPDYNPATGAINVGATGEMFTVLAKGDAGFTDSNITGPSIVTGNIGIGGQGTFAMSDGQLNGDLYIHTGGQYMFSGPASHGAVHQSAADDMTINNALTDMINLSNAAAMEASSPQYASLTNVNITNSANNMTIMGGPNQKIVLNLQNFVMTQGTFTLQGTATTTFIINVQNTFSLNNSMIVLSGVPNANVLFNIIGTGGQVSLNQNPQFSMGGILLAAQRKIDLSGGKVMGRVWGDQVVITSGGQVISQ